MRLSIRLLLALAALLCVAGPVGAQRAPESPHDARTRALADEAIAQAGAPEGVLPLVDLLGQSVRADPDVLAQSLDRVLAARLPDERRALASWVRALVRSHHGDRPAATRAIATLGFLTDFWVAGPFDNDGDAGFTDELAPEAARRGAFPDDAVYEGKGHPVRFVRFPAQSAWDGYVGLRTVVRPSSAVCAVAATTVTSRTARNLRLYVGAAGAVKVYWNGVLAFMDGAVRADFPDRFAIPVGAHAGANRLVVKVCNDEGGGLGFYARVTDDRGRRAPDVTASAERMPEPPEGHGTRAQPTAQSAFDLLRRAAEAEGASAAARHLWARFLVTTGADDRTDRKAREIAARAATDEPTLDRLELAYALAEERGERMRFVRIATEHSGMRGDPKTRVLQARLASASARPVDALPLLEGFEPGGTLGLTVRRLRADLYADLGLPRSALAEARAVVAVAPRSFEAQRELIERLRAVGRTDEALEVARTALALRPYDLSTRRELLTARLARGEVDAARAELAALAALDPTDDGTLASVAAAYEGLDDLETAERLLRQAIAGCPDEPARHAQLGRLLLRRGRQAEAIASLHTVLALRPQEADVRELLEDLESTARDDERFATPLDTILGRRRDAAGYAYTTLHDLTVNTVYDNGLASNFRQIAYQIHDEEGARRFRAYGIPYEPSVARVDVRSAKVVRQDGTVLEATSQFAQPMADPAYRMYYDSVNLAVVFPDLEPGDVVEIRYRVDEVASDNRFGDYYGDLRVLQGDAPIARLEYVLRTPSARTFYVNAPALEGLVRERSEEDGRRTDRYVVSDVPALRAEARMPGLTEVSPYLHVSTYRSWEDVGRWYWGLVKDQLVLDDELRRTVRELVEGAPDVETKVRRIHDWVVDHTRYVALEFGIHGFKPYRVTQIVRRGFGDCKDKASLLYAMLQEAGIDAQLVLVRTRRNGAIESLPASLAVFDHAIAYVPALDLYIDGTAEHSGLRELPAMDQGVTVLHVHAGGAALRRTPVLPADASVRERTTRFALRADGGATIRSEETVSGSEAAYVRAQYEAEGTREERMRRGLRGVYPGVLLDSFTVEGVDDRERAPRVTYVADAPRVAQVDAGTLRMAPSALDDVLRMLAPTPSRTLPMELGAPSSYVEHRHVAPQGLRVRELPEAGQVDSPFGSASLACREEPEGLVCETTFRVTVDRVEARDFAAFYAFAERVDRLFRQRIKFEVTP